jgi:hypothetical protein
MSRINIKQLKSNQQGSILFSNENNRITEDISKLNWDYNNNEFNVIGKINTEALSITGVGIDEELDRFLVTDTNGNVFYKTDVLSQSDLNFITNPQDNRVLTSTGSQSEANAESNLTFDGSKLSVIGGVSCETVLDIRGTNGQLFSITDSLEGSLFSISDISGIPIFEVFSDNTINFGTFGAEPLKISGSNILLEQVSTDETTETGLFLDSNNNIVKKQVKELQENPFGLEGQIHKIESDNSNVIVPRDIILLGNYIKSDQELTDAQANPTTFTSFEQVFDTWKRFSHGSSNSLSDNIPGQVNETQSWNYNSGTEQINTTVNSQSHIGFISNIPLSSYTLDARLFSTNPGDNDRIGIVIAFVEDEDDLVPNQAFGLDPASYPGVNTTDEFIPNQHTLTLLRNRDNLDESYFISYNYGKTSRKIVANGSTLLTNTLDDWGSAFADVRVERDGDIIKGFTLNFSDLTQDVTFQDTEITVDLNSDPDLEKFKGPARYGFSSLSQQGASFSNISISGTGLNEIYDIRNGDIYEADSSGTWTINTSRDLSNEILKRSVVFNPQIKSLIFYRDVSDYDIINNTSIAELDIPDGYITEVKLSPPVQTKLNATVGSGGYAANIYYSNADSTTVTGYKKLSYEDDATATILETVVNDNEVLIDEFISDSEVIANKLPSGVWSFNTYCKVSQSNAITKIRFEVFKRTSSDVETVLFSLDTIELNNNTFEMIQTQSSKPSYEIDPTDRLGVKVYANTTRTSNVTVSFEIGNGNASYVNAPLQIRHSQLRGTGDDDLHPINSITNLQSELDSKEDSFTKNSAFNKNFGVVSGSVAQGNDSRIINGQIAYNDKINTITVTGDANKTITLTQQDGSTITANFNDNNDGVGTTDIKINALDFEITDGVLTATRDDSVEVTTSLDGRYALLGHTHTVSEITDFPTDLSFFNNGPGYLTSATDTYVGNVSFNTGNGELTLSMSVNDGSPFSSNYNLTADLDGRYVDLTTAQIISGSKAFEGTTRFIDNAQVRIGSSGNGTLKFQSTGSTTLADMEGDIIFRDGTSGFVERVRITTDGIEDNRTGLGKPSRPYVDIPSGEWSKRIGESTWYTGDSDLSPDGSAGYWFITGKRDVSNGYGGIFIDYSDGRLSTGLNNTGGDPTWVTMVDDSNNQSISGEKTFINDVTLSNGLLFDTSSVRLDRISDDLLGNAVNSFIFNIDSNGDDVGAFILRSNGNERMRMASNGNVGIGTTNPSSKLEVNGDVTASIYFDRENTSYYVNPSQITRLNLVYGGIYYDKDNTSYFVNPSQSSNLDSVTAGTLRSNNIYPTTSTTRFVRMLSTGDSIRVAGDIVAFSSSDRRFKKNIKNIESPIDIISKIGGYKFEWNEKSHKETDKKDIGVIAQEIEEVLPELVETRENGYKAVDYTKISALLIEGMKDQQKDIKNQDNKLKSLEQRIKDLENKIK